MKTTLLMTAAAFLGLSAYAEDTTTCTKTTTQGCPNGCCCAPNVMPDGKIQACNTEWLNVDTVQIDAANGDPIAQYTVAYLTSDGSDTPMKDDPAISQKMSAQAMTNLKKAADSGHAGACMALAHMYQKGCCGCEKNTEMSQKYMKMAQDCQDKSSH